MFYALTVVKPFQRANSVVTLRIVKFDIGLMTVSLKIRNWSGEMNAHQRRVARRAEERQQAIADSEIFGCQDCGDTISFGDGTAYVTASGDVYCRSCGIAMDEAEEEMWEEENEFSLWDYNTWEDYYTGESGGVYIGPENDTMGIPEPPTDDDNDTKKL